MELIKRLRTETKAGVMQCRDALEEAKGDVEKARTIVMSKMLKNRDNKTMAEGLVGLALGKDSKDWAVAVEVSCETDFVARGTSLGDLVAKCVSDVSAAAQRGVAGEEALLASVKESAKTELDNAMRATGERIGVRRAAVVRGERVWGYLHAPTGQARVAALVALGGSGEAAVGSRLAVHIAGMKPTSKQELLDQPFAAMGAGAGTVGEKLQKSGLTLQDFARLEVGEGVQVQVEDFAAQVKAALKQ